MPVPGYDPIDVDHMLESRLADDEIETHLDDEALSAYRSGEASLVDLLEDETIQELLETA